MKDTQKIEQTEKATLAQKPSQPAHLAAPRARVGLRKSDGPTPRTAMNPVAAMRDPPAAFPFIPPSFDPTELRARSCRLTRRSVIRRATTILHAK